MRNWSHEKLGNLGTLTSSKRIFKKEYVESGIPFYRSKEIKELGNNRDVTTELFITDKRYEEIKKQFGIPSKGDILLTAVGTIGEMYIVEGDHDFYFKDGNIMWLKDFKILNPYFLKYALTSFVEQIEAMSQGSAYNALTIEKLKKYSIPFPSLPEQKQIVSILDKAFAAIDQAKANIERNIENAKELFQSKLNEIFSQKGEGWEEKKLGEITSKIGSGATPKGGQASYKESGISLIRSMNVHDDGFREKNLAFIDEEQASKLNNVTIEENDVLLNITGASVARCCIVDNNYLPARVNQHVSIIRLKNGILNPEFLHYALTSKLTKDKLLGIGEQGATRQAITKTQIENFSIKFPTDLKTQTSLVCALNEIRSNSEKLVKKYNLKLESLEELKKSILQKAFAGELTEKEVAV